MGEIQYFDKQGTGDPFPSVHIWAAQDRLDAFGNFLPVLDVGDGHGATSPPMMVVRIVSLAVERNVA